MLIFSKFCFHFSLNYMGADILAFSLLEMNKFHFHSSRVKSFHQNFSSKFSKIFKKISKFLFQIFSSFFTRNLNRKLSLCFRNEIWPYFCAPPTQHAPANCSIPVPDFLSVFLHVLCDSISQSFNFLGNNSPFHCTYKYSLMIKCLGARCHVYS